MTLPHRREQDRYHRDFVYEAVFRNAREVSTDTVEQVQQDYYVSNDTCIRRVVRIVLLVNEGDGTLHWRIPHVYNGRPPWGLRLDGQHSTMRFEVRTASVKRDSTDVEFTEIIASWKASTKQERVVIELEFYEEGWLDRRSIIALAICRLHWNYFVLSERQLLSIRVHLPSSGRFKSAAIRVNDSESGHIATREGERIYVLEKRHPDLGEMRGEVGFLLLSTELVATVSVLLGLIGSIVLAVNNLSFEAVTVLVASTVVALAALIGIVGRP